MKALRTPDSRFENLPDFPWQPRYLTDLEACHGLRLAHWDEGPPDARHVALCLHGEPTWTYLYRKMIPVFLDAGMRVVALDWLGFGRSDKPVDDAAYTFDLHREVLLGFVRRLDLERITLVVQDWGGLLGLTLPLDEGARIERLIVMNTALATGEVPSDGFEAWRDYVASQHDLAVGRLMKRAAPGLSDSEAAAYDAPFPDAEHKAGVRSFPQLVATAPDMPGADVARRAAEWWRDQWHGKSFMAVGKQDPVLGPPVMEQLRGTIAGCPEPLVLEDAGHFVQERGDVVARAALDAFGSD